MSKTEMDVATVLDEYERTLRLLEGKNAKDLFMPQGKPLTVYGVRHYCAAMKVLFDRIKVLEDERDQLEEQLRESEDEIIRLKVTIRDLQQYPKERA